MDRISDYENKKSIIVMISDGAPVDDSTITQNDSAMLSSHLESVVNWIEGVDGVNLYGVGVEFDTTQYYSRGIPAATAKNIGIDIMRELPGWLGNSQN